MFSKNRSTDLPKVGKYLPKLFAGSRLSMSSNCTSKSFLKGDQCRKPREAEGEIKKLKEENLQLKCELEDLRYQYQQLLEEGNYQHYDERRVTLLKAQVLQLERQVLLLAEGLSSRAAQMLEIENALASMNEQFRSLLSSESQASEVLFSRAKLLQLIEMCQALQWRLQARHTATTIENLSIPWLMSGRNLTKHPLTLLDLCHGKMDNLNFQQVSVLESKLSELYRHLNAIKHTLSLILAPGQESHEHARHILPNVIYARLLNHVVRCNQSLEECCTDLLTLTLIIPSAPWAKLEHEVCQEFTVENVLSALPTFPKGAPQQRAKRAVEALVKAANYSRLMAMQQVTALQSELDFHKRLYNIQIKYTESVFQAIKQAYHAFQANVAEILCLPLQDVLTSYTNLKVTASETALGDFLAAFKNNAEQMQDAVNALTPSPLQQSDGDEALSTFGREFFLSLERCLKDCAKQQDSLTHELEALKVEFSLAFEILQTLRKERLEKRSSGWRSTQYAFQIERENSRIRVGDIGSRPHDELARKEFALSQPAIMTAATTAASLRHTSRVLPLSISAEKKIHVTSQSQDDPSECGISETQIISHPRAKLSQKTKIKMNQPRPPWQD